MTGDYTTRCNAKERVAFRQPFGEAAIARTEPALGTLEERLDIIIRRLGGTTKRPKVHSVEEWSLYLGEELQVAA